MSWRSAFLTQAASDYSVRVKLNSAHVEYCHQLHYLQMVCEKLAKGRRLRETDVEPPEFLHGGFARLLRTLKSDPSVRRRLGYEGRTDAFRTFINGLLPLAHDIEQLAPSSAGANRPNPEYPWRDLATGEIVPPSDYNFTAFDPRDSKMVQMETLLSKLLSLD